MTTSSGHTEAVLELSREEQWMLHHVMLDRMELEARSPAETDPPPVAVYRVFEKLETGTHRFSRCERRCLRAELCQHAEAMDTPERDRPLATQILDKLRRAEPEDAEFASDIVGRGGVGVDTV